MPKYRVLVVDDSPIARMAIIEHLSQDDEIEIAGFARNGKEAIEKVKELKPSLVTMDINMPIMGGLETIEQIMAYNPVPVLVVTSRGDADTAYSAISKGALEVIPKPEIGIENSEDFIRKIKLLSKVKVISHLRGRHVNENRNQCVVSLNKNEREDKRPEKAIVIASSTGGPKALLKILSELPENLPAPVFVAQHIPTEFVNGLAEWLNGVCKLRVKAGERGELIQAGVVYISPVNKTMVINNKNRIELYTQVEGAVYFPSCDHLLATTGKTYKDKCMGLILTGMGNDGVEGISDIKKNGGITIAQDEESSIVFGMPKVAIERGSIYKVLPLEKMSQEILRFVRAV